MRPQGSFIFVLLLRMLSFDIKKFMHSFYFMKNKKKIIKQLEEVTKISNNILEGIFPEDSYGSFTVYSRQEIFFNEFF